MKDKDRLDKRIEDALREERAAPPFPRKQIEARIKRSVHMGDTVPRRRRPLIGHPAIRGGLAVAASLVVFVAGAEYGRRTSAATAGTPIAYASLSTPISIQSAGSEYVARLAQFGADADRLSDDVREEARQVALATLYAASIELLRESEDDELLATVAQLIFSRRQANQYPEHAGAIWF